MSRTQLFGVFALLLVSPASTLAQEHQHATSDEKLGTVHFATSCNAPAQKQFDRSVALLHSFQFSRAIDGFNSILKSDSSCAMAYWGIALSKWSNPFAAGLKAASQLQEGKLAAEQGLAANAKTDR